MITTTAVQIWEVFNLPDWDTLVSAASGQSTIKVRIRPHPTEDADDGNLPTAEADVQVQGFRRFTTVTHVFFKVVSLAGGNDQLAGLLGQELEVSYNFTNRRGIA